MSGNIPLSWCIHCTWIYERKWWKKESTKKKYSSSSINTFWIIHESLTNKIFTDTFHKIVYFIVLMHLADCYELHTRLHLLLFFFIFLFFCLWFVFCVCFFLFISVSHIHIYGECDFSSRRLGTWLTNTLNRFRLLKFRTHLVSSWCKQLLYIYKCLWNA